MRSVLPDTTVRWLAWCLLACMAWASLHSGLAAWQPSDRGSRTSGLVEVCTGDGIRWLSLTSSADSAQAQRPPADHSEHHGIGTVHCPWCRLVADAWPDLARSDLGFAPPAEYRMPSLRMPALLGHTERTVLATPARAPPQVSG